MKKSLTIILLLLFVLNGLVLAGPKPKITSATTDNATQGVYYSFQITASNGPILEFEALNLPGGLSVDTGTGIIDGTPTVNGVYDISLRARNSAGWSVPDTLTLTIAAAPPVITSSLTDTTYQDSPYSYFITATNTPTSYDATPLPTGLSVNTSTGEISGTPTVSGVFNIDITATNSGGSDTQTLELTINIPPAPVITSATSDSGTETVAYSYFITATNNPTSYNASGLPSGLSVNTSTGEISGTPAVGSSASSPYSVTISATNAGGTGQDTLTLTISVLTPPVITSSLTDAWAQDSPYSYFIVATNEPTSYDATSLPPGLSVNTSTGEISGTPTASGNYNVDISATNASGTDNQVLALTIYPPTTRTTYIPMMLNYGTDWIGSLVFSNYGTATCSAIYTLRDTDTGVILDGPTTIGLDQGDQVIITSLPSDSLFSVEVETNDGVVVQGQMLTLTNDQCIALNSYDAGFTTQYLPYIEYRSVADTYIMVHNNTAASISYTLNYYSDTGTTLSSTAEAVPARTTVVLQPTDSNARRVGLEGASGNLIALGFYNYIENFTWSINPLDVDSSNDHYIPYMVNNPGTFEGYVSLGNSSGQNSSINYTYRDSSGTTIGSGSTTVPRNERILLPSLPTGAFSIQIGASKPITVLAYYVGSSGITNGDFIATFAFEATNTLPATYTPASYTKQYVIMNTTAGAQAVTWDEWDGAGAKTTSSPNIPAYGFSILTPDASNRMSVFTGTGIVGVEIITTGNGRIYIVPLVQTSTT